MTKPHSAEASVVEGRARLRSVLADFAYALVFVGLVAATTYFAVNRLDPTYLATATVAIEAPSVAPAAQVSTVDPRSAQIQIVRSREIARAVIDRLGLSTDPEFQSDPSPLGRILAVIGFQGAATAPLERALDNYFARLSVQPGARSDEIAITFAAHTGPGAAAAANAVAEEYIALQRSVRREAAADASAALAAQVAAQRSKLADAESRLARYRAEHPPVAPVSADRISAMERDLAAATASRADLDKQLAQLETLIVGGEPVAIAAFAGASERMKDAGARLAEVRAELSRLGETRVPQDPRMRELATESAALAREIVAEGAAMLTVLRADAERAAANETAAADELARTRRAAADAADVATLTAALEREVAAQRGILAAYTAHEEAAVATALGVADIRMANPAKPPLVASAMSGVPATLVAAILALALSTLVVVVRANRMVVRAADDRPSVAKPASAAPSVRPARQAGSNRITRKEPSLVPEMVDQSQDSLAAVAAEIGRSGKQRVLVTMAEGSDGDGRPLGAVALARALARDDARVVLIDLRRDGANVRSMGEAGDLPGFSDLFRGESSFAQVIFRDGRSRVHFIPCGRAVLPADGIDREHLETVLSALTLTYDFVLLDVPDGLIGLVGPSCGIAMVVSEFGAGDPRTTRAFARIADVADLRTLLLVVDPAPQPAERRQIAVPDEVAA